MNAKDAYTIAAAQGDINDLLIKIEGAARSGRTFIKVPTLNNFQVKGLTDLGYMVIPDHSDDTFALTSRSVPTMHRIDWNFPDSKKTTISVGS